jgi:hypothetical protein
VVEGGYGFNYEVEGSLFFIGKIEEWGGGGGGG